MQAQQFLDIHQQVAAMDGSDATVRAQNAPEGLRVQLGMLLKAINAADRLQVQLGMVAHQLKQA
eukprot:scaffold568_cov19-Tisochrysis_lutea.AAC.1